MEWYGGNCLILLMLKSGETYSPWLNLPSLFHFHRRQKSTERPEDEEEEEFTWSLSDWENWLESSSADTSSGSDPETD